MVDFPGNPRSRLSMLLWLIALHSFVVGTALIVLPPALFRSFGYSEIGEPFFKVQGGVFHLVMVIAYTRAAHRPETSQQLVLFSILAKAMATIFLFTYFLFADRILVVLLSGFGDCLMGVLIFFFNQSMRTSQNTQL